MIMDGLMAKTKFLDRSWKRSKILQLRTFLFDIIYDPNVQFEVLVYWILIFLNSLDWRKEKNKVVDLKELYNFVVAIFIWNHLLNKNSVWISHILKTEIFKRP